MLNWLKRYLNTERQSGEQPSLASAAEPDPEMPTSERRLHRRVSVGLDARAHVDHDKLGPIATQGKVMDVSLGGLRFRATDIRHDKVIGILKGSRGISIRVVGKDGEPVEFHGTIQWVDHHDRTLALPEHCYLGMAFGRLDSRQTALLHHLLDAESS
ncbi:hypothetical protein GC173_00785 [bacterium]|nr:hypothetical protein [bacterium]